MYDIETVLSKVGPKLVARFASKVIHRWSQHRANRFFGALVEGLADGTLSEEDVLARIETALDDEAKSEVLFDAYRRVCLSASRDAGPRLIGLLTAKILSEGRTANEVEERLFMAAETLSDNEFASLLKFFREARQEHDGEAQKGGTVLVESHSEHDDSNRPSGEIDISPLNLGDSYGAWALKAASVGILVQRIVRDRQEYTADSDRYVDMDGVATSYTWFVGFDAAFLDYLDVIALSAREL